MQKEDIIFKIKYIWLLYFKSTWLLHKNETIKYFVRFGLVLMIVVPILCFYRGPDSIQVIFYKISQLFIGVACAEVIWAIFFKPYFSVTEVTSDARAISYMLFRGLLYVGCIIGFCLGL